MKYQNKREIDKRAGYGEKINFICKMKSLSDDKKSEEFYKSTCTPVYTVIKVLGLPIVPRALQLVSS